MSSGNDDDVTASGVNRMLSTGFGGLLTLGMKAGWWGVTGFFLAGLGKIAQFFWPSERVGYLSTGLLITSCALVLTGLLAHAKRSTDMQATIAVESKRDKLQIAALSTSKTSLVTVRVTHDVLTSADPAVQREINKTLRPNGG